MQDNNKNNNKVENINNIPNPFRLTKFYDTVDDINKLPENSICEIAIIGRSNAGKSSLLNTLTDQHKLAFTSKMPGRTQHINYFSIANKEGVFLIDLPGYGYAKVPEKIRVKWSFLLGSYLHDREQLYGLILIMDARHPLKELDYKMLECVKFTNRKLHIVLSKSDKLTYQESLKTIKFVKEQLDINAYKNYTIQLFSSLKKTGMSELLTCLNLWLTEIDA